MKSEQNTERFAEKEKIDAKVIKKKNKEDLFELSVKHLEIQEEKEALKEYGSSSSGASIGDIIGAALDENTKKKPEDLENEKNDFLNHYFEKRKSLIFRYFLAFLLIIFAFWILIDKSSSENFIAKIYLNGVINDRSSLIKK